MLALFNKAVFAILLLISSFNTISDKIEFVEEELPIMYLNIEKINVHNAVYEKSSINNDIDKNVTIMDESNLPIDEFGNVILGAHSGVGRLAYFKDFGQLEVNDEITVDYDNKKYKYIIKRIYTDDKDGKIVIRRNLNKNTLTLFTCNPGDDKNYLIVIAELF